MKKIAQREIARKCGVSVSTVSLVLADRRVVRISQEVKEKVLRTANRLGYTQKKRKTLTRNIGLILRRNVSHFFADPYYRELFTSIQRNLSKRGYSILFSSPEEKMVGKGCPLPEEILHRKVDGLIILGNVLDSFLKNLKEFDLPFVLINYTSPSLETDSIWFDNEEATRKIMRHLLKLGHRKILFLYGREGSINFDLRFKTYLEIMKENNLKPLVFKTQTENAEDVYRRLKDFLPFKEEITAIFGSNDGNALGALRVVKEKGFRVPESLSIVGFDDIPEAEKSEPPLTTLRVPLQEMGKIGVETLLKKIEREDRGLPLKILVPTKLIIRGSTAPVNLGIKRQ